MGYKKFKVGIKVEVCECYLTDEVTEGRDLSKDAKIFFAPIDDDQLVGIEFESGELDYVPQNILSIS